MTRGDFGPCTPCPPAVTAARQAGFPTFVVGIAINGGFADSVLNLMANEGGYLQVGQATQYYPVTSTAQFEPRFPRTRTSAGPTRTPA